MTINYKIEPPEGYEIDREKSTIDNIVFKPKESKDSNEYSTDLTNKEPRFENSGSNNYRYYSDRDRYYDAAYKAMYKYYGYDYGGYLGKYDTPDWISEYIDNCKRWNSEVDSHSATIAYRWHYALDVLFKKREEDYNRVIDKLWKENPSWTREEIKEYYDENTCNGYFWGERHLEPRYKGFWGPLLNFIHTFI